MPDRRLLYLTAQRLQACSWKAGRLVADASFMAGDQGVAEFARYITGSPKALYYVVADVVEEDFFQENIPYVRGKDRRNLLGRKLAQRYRDISLAFALSLGTQEGVRREERMLFTSFTNTQQFQAWLSVLRSSEARLVGVYSLALIAPLVAKRLNIAARRFVLVSVQDGGMRQSYVEDGKIRFSRLGRADATDPRATAEACAAESNRILQYLINLRVLDRDTAPLDVLVLAPAADRAAYQAGWGDNPRLKLDFRDLESACQKAGLKSAPIGMLGERLFLHVLATAQPADQFASDRLRRFYHVWRARLALLTGGAAVCALTLLLAGVRTMELNGVNGTIELQNQQEASVTREYDSLQATFPKTPLPRETLRAAVSTARAILHQTQSPERLFGEISQALSAVPQVELDTLAWAIGDSPRPPGAADASKAAPAPSAPAAAPAPGGADRIFEVVDITARINGVKGNDYRAINTVVQQFASALRQRPGIEVISTRTPFDVLTEKQITGDVSEEDRTEAPRFTIKLSRRIDT